MRLALAQINTTVGDFQGNLTKITGAIGKAALTGADLVALPELAITGYPPEDLLLKTSFLAANRECLDAVVTSTKDLDLTAVVGFVDVEDGEIYNSAAVIHHGGIAAIYHKIYLPNYGVFDEKRYFGSGKSGLVCTCAGVKVGVTICEDIWHPMGPMVLEARRGGAQLILNISSSPYSKGKQYRRERMLAVRAADNLCYLAYVNLVGAQDELVFDGNSMLFDEQGKILLKGAGFKEQLLLADLRPEEVLRGRLHDVRHREFQMLPDEQEQVLHVIISAEPDENKPPLPEHKLVNDAAQSLGNTVDTAALSLLPVWEDSLVPGLNGLESDSEEGGVYSALVLGVRDYVNKNGFNQVIIGLSGGIDSAITAAIAVDALGSDQVICVFMPSPITSEESRRDATDLAANLGIKLLNVPIGEIFAAYCSTLNQMFDGNTGDLTTQNIQARIRGNLLMAMANQYGTLVLTTGNKSEMSAGYATLYGDMAGGFAVLKDIPKTLVYQISNYRNQIAGREVIPANILVKAPTAELKPDQKDQDDLPPYSLLDRLIELYVEQDCSAGEIINMDGVDPELVNRVIGMVDKSEFKRRQAPPGVKITPRAYGKDRRMPITNRFKEKS